MELEQLQRWNGGALTQVTQALTQANQRASQYGLTLTQRQMRVLLQQRQEALLDTGRVEFGVGVLPQLVEAFCDSPYLAPDNYAETLGELQALFYYFKTESRERLSDQEVMDGMKRLFDGMAQGSVDYLSGVPVEALTDLAWKGDW